MHFARTLRAAGLPVGTGAVLDALRAVEATGLARRDDFYWTLHAVFVRRADQRPLFDEAFHVFWRNPRLLERVTSLLLPTVQTPPRGDARPLSRRLSEALFAGAEREARVREEEEVELDATLTWSDREILRERDFEQMSAAELAEAKAAIAKLRFAVPPAPTRRYRPHSRGALVDMRTTLRRSLRRGAGEVLLVHRRKVRKPAPIVVLCDISGSMRQRATLRERTTKLLAAKVAIDEFVQELAGDRVGLVTFQSTALLMSPLTLDRVALARQVWSLEPGLVADGTAIGLGLSEAVNLLRDSPARSRVIVLLTDGENNAGEVPPLQAARIAEALDIRVYTIGFHGATRSTSGVDVRLLQQIASTTGGAYYDASSPDEVEQAYESVRTLERSRVGERQFTEFEELAPRLAIAAILLLLAEAGLRSTLLRRYP